jgi:DNA-binding SARP family transcriptional activator
MWLLRVLGAPVVEHDGAAVRFERRKSLALLVYLRRQPHALARDHLAAMFWPDQEPERGRASLRSALADLTRVLGAECVTRSTDTLALDPRFGIGIDIEQIERPDDAASLTNLIARAALYRGRFLEGVEFAELSAFSEWVYFQREAAEVSLGRLLAHIVERAIAAGDLPTAETFAQRWTQHSRLDEQAWRQLMTVHARSRKPAKLIAAYRECMRTLETELGVEPSAETRALHEALLAPGDQPMARTVSAVEIAARPPVQYFRSGDAHIAYCTIGREQPVLLTVAGFFSHLEQIWEEPGLAGFLNRLAAHSRLVLFDKRGVGLSDRTGEAPTIERVSADALALLDHLKVPRAFVLGVSEGGPSAICMASQFPERIEGLVLYATGAKWTRSPDYPHALPAELYQKWLAWLEQNWGKAASVEQFAPSRRHDRALAHWWAKTLRLAASPGSIRRVLEAAQHTDVRALLPGLRVPTLVVHRRGDAMIRVANGRYLAQHIPGARLLELEGDDHWFWVGELDEFHRALRDFLTAHAAVRPSERTSARMTP